MELNRGDKLYYARVLPTVGIYELLELTVISVRNTYFTTTETKTKRAYTFNNTDFDKYVFADRSTALEIVKNAEKNKPKIEEETYYEEY